MSALAAILAAVAATTASLAAGPSPEPRDNTTTADLTTIFTFTAVFFPILMILLAFACLRLFHIPGAPRAGAGAAASPTERSRRGGPRGLDAAAISALPLVFYRDVRRHRIVDGDGALECSVCLTEFDDDDALRLLPTCPHAFHPECIGLWLERHATCPLCRASLLDAPALQTQLQPAATVAPLPPDSPPDHPTVVLIGDAGDREEDEEDWSRIQCLARNRRAAGRQALPRANSTGHDGGGSSTERFVLRLPEHVRMEIVMSPRLRHVTSAVESVRVREGSAHGSLGGSVRSAVARLLSRFAAGAGWKGDGDDKSVKVDAAGASSLRRRENSCHGAVGEEKRSV